MSLISQPILDYSDRDFASLRLRLQGLARSVFPEWTDFNTANYGNTLIEMMAYVGDLLTFYQDAQAREMFWPTLARRISAIRQGRLINFTLTGAAQATGSVRFSIPAPLVNRVEISPGTIIRSLDPITPQLIQTTNTELAYIPIGQLFADIPCEQTETVSNEIFQSSGAPNQEFVLSRIPYLDNSLTVTATDGDYTQIDSFLNIVDDNQRRFVVVVDENDRARVRFGNGALGKIPVGGISCNYKLTNGAKGNISAGSLGTVVDSITDELGNPVNGIFVTNPEALSGGTNRMSVAQARALAPASLRALTRTVSAVDFETHALEVNGIARALMLTSNEDATIQENHGVLLLIAFGQQLVESGNFQAATPSATMIANVTQKFVEKPPTITFSLAIQAAPFVNVNVSARLYLRKGAVATTVKEDVTNALKDYFCVAFNDGSSNTNVDFGAKLTNEEGIPIAEIAWGDIFDVITDVDGIRKVDEGATGLLLNNLRQSVTIGLRQFPQLGTLTLYNAETGLALV
jgi:hypothetical protein